MTIAIRNVYQWKRQNQEINKNTRYFPFRTTGSFCVFNIKFIITEKWNSTKFEFFFCSLLVVYKKSIKFLSRCNIYVPTFWTFLLCSLSRVSPLPMRSMNSVEAASAVGVSGSITKPSGIVNDLHQKRTIIKINSQCTYEFWRHE